MLLQRDDESDAGRRAAGGRHERVPRRSQTGPVFTFWGFYFLNFVTKELWCAENKDQLFSVMLWCFESHRLEEHW